MFFTHSHGDDGFYRQKGNEWKSPTNVVDVFREIPAYDVVESNILLCELMLKWNVLGVEVECPGCVQNTRGPQRFPRIGWTEQWQEHYILGMVPSKSSQQTNPMMIAFVEGPTCSKCPSPGGLSRLVPLSSDHPDRSFSSVLKAAEFMMCLGTFWYPRGWTSICQLFWLFLTKGIKGCNDEHEVVSVFNSPRLWCFYLFSIITW